MEISFKITKLQKACKDFSRAQKEYGEQIAKKLHQRLNELRSADNLYIISQIRSARLHELSGDRKGEYAVDLTGNFRLIMTAVNGKLELSKIEAVNLESVEDYH